MARIELTMIMRAPIERCFDLTRSIDAHLHSAAQTGERAIAGVTTGLVVLGDEVTWRAKHLGVWQSLSSRITAFDRPRHFQDTMIKGAFSSFVHDHYFETVPDGTKVIDQLVIKAPLGPLGWLAERAVLVRHLRRFLTRRNEAIRDLAESDGWKQFTPREQAPISGDSSTS